MRRLSGVARSVGESRRSDLRRTAASGNWRLRGFRKISVRAKRRSRPMACSSLTSVEKTCELPGRTAHGMSRLQPPEAQAFESPIPRMISATSSNISSQPPEMSLTTTVAPAAKAAPRDLDRERVGGERHARVERALRSPAPAPPPPPRPGPAARFGRRPRRRRACRSRPRPAPGRPPSACSGVPLRAPSNIESTVTLTIPAASGPDRTQPATRTPLLDRNELMTRRNLRPGRGCDRRAASLDPSLP